MKVLFIGDVVGSRGMEALHKYLPTIKKDYKPNMIFINGENIAKGLGITEKLYKELMTLGANVITLGNHAFSKREVSDFINDSKLIRPINYPANVPGEGHIIVKYNDIKVCVINLMGRVFMNEGMENPFYKMDEVLKDIEADYIFVDFHAETTSEKLALAHYLDGRVTAVVGTHTHVPTADAMTLPNNTMYITDIGMTGTKYGIIGADKNQIINRFLTAMHSRMEEDMSKELQFNAVLMDTDTSTIKQIQIIE